MKITQLPIKCCKQQFIHVSLINFLIFVISIYNKITEKEEGEEEEQEEHEAEEKKERKKWIKGRRRKTEKINCLKETVRYLLKSIEQFHNFRL